MLRMLPMLRSASRADEDSCCSFTASRWLGCGATEMRSKLCQDMLHHAENHGRMPNLESKVSKDAIRQLPHAYLLAIKADEEDIALLAWQFRMQKPC